MAVARADAASGGRGACIKLSLAKAPAFPSMFPMATCPPVRRQCLGGRPAGGSEKIVRLPVVLFGRRVGPTAPELGGLVGMSAAGATTHVFESAFPTRGCDIDLCGTMLCCAHSVFKAATIMRPPCCQAHQCNLCAYCGAVAGIIRRVCP